MLSGSVPFPAETSVGTLLAHRSASRPSACALCRRFRPRSTRCSPRAWRSSRRRGRPRRRLRAPARMGAGRDRHRRPRCRRGDEAVARALADRHRARGRSSWARRRPLIGAAIFALIVAALLIYLLVAGGEPGAPDEHPAALTIDVPRDPVSVAPGAKFVWVVSALPASYGLQRETAAAGACDTRSPTPGCRNRARLRLGVTANSLYRLAVDGSDIDRAEVEFRTRPTSPSIQTGSGCSTGEDPPRPCGLIPKTLERTATPSSARPAGHRRRPRRRLGDEHRRRHRDRDRPQQRPGRRQRGRRRGPAHRRRRRRRPGLGDRQPRRAPDTDRDRGRQAVAGEPITTLPRPRGVALGFGSVWVASEQENVLERFDVGGDHGCRRAHGGRGAGRGLPRQRPDLDGGLGRAAPSGIDP